MHKKLYLYILFIILATIALLLSGCGLDNSPKTTDEKPSYIRCAPNKIYTWDGDIDPSLGKKDCLYLDTRTFIVKGVLVGPQYSHQTYQGEGDIYGNSSMTYGSMSFWTEGKGILPIKIISITPDDFPGVHAGDVVIIKTEDLKAMGIIPGWIATFACNQDVEIVKPVYRGQPVTPDRVSYELDDCRLVTGVITQEGTQ